MKVSRAIEILQDRLAEYGDCDIIFESNRHTYINDVITYNGAKIIIPLVKTGEID